MNLFISANPVFSANWGQHYRSDTLRSPGYTPEMSANPILNGNLLATQEILDICMYFALMLSRAAQKIYVWTKPKFRPQNYVFYVIIILHFLVALPPIVLLIYNDF